jgi:hypothetical protein
MRPRKDKDMKNWTASQLKEVLRSKKSPEALKKKVERIFQDRQEKGWEFLQKFFNQGTNKFWLLAKWQLFREGKAKVYGTGKHARFYIEDSSLIFDKMIEIKKKFDKYQTGKSQEAEIKREFESWKR